MALREEVRKPVNLKLVLLNVFPLMSQLILRIFLLYYTRCFVKLLLGTKAFDGVSGFRAEQLNRKRAIRFY